MKTELRLVPHSVIPGEQVIELWYADEFIGTVTGADGTGVRLITKHAVKVTQADIVTEIRIDTMSATNN
jgi:hypothetical protein